MKKIFLLFCAIVLSMVLFACNKYDSHDEIFKNINITFNDNDNEMNVTENITFEYIETNDVTIVITSSNDAITIQDNTLGIVTRGSEDILVEIAVLITIEELSKVYPIEFKVLKLKEENEFSVNLENFTHVIGTEIPNYEDDLVVILNDIDVTHEVIINDEAVLWDEVGTYIITFKYTIDEITYTKEVYVNVIVYNNTNKPVIYGTKDFTHIIGSQALNYLEGITATDNDGNNLNVTVDTSEVDLNKPGAYKIHYKAIDKNDNETILTHEVVVIGDNAGVSETITEDFANLNTGSSSYTTGSFTGIQGINWQYEKARTDQELDGNALTFRHEAGGKLTATIDSGISYFSIQAINVYSGAEQREFALYINNTLIQKFNSTSVVQTFEVNNLDYKEAIVLEIRNTGNLRVTIDNIVIGIDNKSIEEKYLDVEVNRLSIPQIFLSETTINLASNINDVNITWDYKDLSNSNNQYIDLSNGLITVPNDNNSKVDVVITATLEYEGYVILKDFTLTIGEGEPITIKEVINSLNNSEVKTQGVITSSIKVGNTYYAYVEDNNNGLYIETKDNITLTEGTEVILKGFRDTKNGVSYLTNVYDVNVLGTKTLNVETVNLNSINNHIGRKVAVEGYLKANTTLNLQSFSIVSSDATINIVIPNYVIITNINNQIKGLKVIVEGYVTNSTTIQLLNNNDLIIEDVIDEQKIIQLITDNLTLPSGDIRGNIELPTKELTFNSNITWMSSHDNIISDSGIFNRPEVNTNVTLYYQIKVSNDFTIDGQITLKAYAVEPLMPYYNSLEGLSGTTFNQALKRLIERTGRATGSTAQVKEVDTYNGQNFNIYTGFGSYGNREHVWPNSKLGSAPDYDLHNLRAAVVSVNSSRSNFPFIEKPSNNNGNHQALNQGFYPGDDHVGDVARIVLYISLRYDLSLNLVGNLQMFLRWHELDPVDDFERTRNNNIQAIQDNRNPFIDYPEFVGMYWNTTNLNNTSPTDILLNVLINQELYIVENRRSYVA